MVAFDDTEVLFTDDDPEYRNTKVDSGIPPPSLSALNEIGCNFNPRNQSNRPIRQPHSNNQSNPRSYPAHADIQRPAIDVVGLGAVIASNEHSSDFIVTKLSSPDWKRLMSDRDDVRGRRSDSRLCDMRLVQNTYMIKESLKNSPPEVYASARSWANAYKSLADSSAFIDVSAVKLGHLDYRFKAISEYLKSDTDIRFVDIGSSRGGFTEYILWRAYAMRVKARGWYLPRIPQRPAHESTSNVNSTDRYEFNTSNLLSECRAGENVKVIPSTGGATTPSTVSAAVKQINDDTNRKGVDIVVADDGPDVPELQGDHEKMHYPHLISQIIITLSVLRKGGSLVLKIFDTLTPLSTELLFILYSCFERVAFVKPLPTCMTSPERYVVCNHLISNDVSSIADHLSVALSKIHDTGFKLSHVVSWSRVSADSKFIAQVFDANMKNIQCQLQALSVVSTRINHHNLPMERPSYRDVAEVCLRSWNLPTKR